MPREFFSEEEVEARRVQAERSGMAEQREIMRARAVPCDGCGATLAKHLRKMERGEGPCCDSSTHTPGPIPRHEPSADIKKAAKKKRESIHEARERRKPLVES